MSKTRYILRQRGTSSFVTALPYDYDESRTIDGWDCANVSALRFATEGDALAAASADPASSGLVVEEIEV